MEIYKKLPDDIQNIIKLYFLPHIINGDLPFKNNILKIGRFFNIWLSKRRNIKEATFYIDYRVDWCKYQNDFSIIALKPNKNVNMEEWRSHRYCAINLKYITN